MRKSILSLVTTIVVIVACGGTTAINIEKYDRSCQNLNDCVLVVTDACCGCENAAINVDSQAQYMADLAAAKKNCGSMACPDIQCQVVVAGCLGGLCITQLPPGTGTDAGSDAGSDSGSDAGSH